MDWSPLNVLELQDFSAFRGLSVAHILLSSLIFFWGGEVGVSKADQTCDLLSSNQKL